MNEQLKGFDKVFAFTFKNQVKLKSYIVTTLIVSMLCFLLPVAILVTKELSAKDADGGKEVANEEKVDFATVDEILLIDNTTDKIDLSKLEPLLEEQTGTDFTFTEYEGGLEKAATYVKAEKGKLILLVDQVGRTYNLNVVRPGKSGINKETAQAVSDVLEYAGSAIQEDYNKAITGEDEKEFDPSNLLAMVVSYLNIMVLYFFAIMYGQTVAGNIVMEKNSKLMETLLVSVKPAAVILGKLLAVALSGMMQLIIWLLSVGAGLYGGGLIARMINPKSTMLIKELIDMATGIAQNMISPINLILAIVLALSGILLYCSLAGVGGAIAGKQEDLAATNGLFVLVILACFFVALGAGGMDGATAENAWMDLVPFTAVMVTPAKVLLGGISIAKGLLSLAIVTITIIVLTLLSGKIYKAMALYKGNMPSLKKLMGMIK